MRVLALLATYNEERFIGGCLEHLFAQGVEAYLCRQPIDRRHRRRSPSATSAPDCAVSSRFPRDGIYRWRRILRRKEALASELAADWFLHLDADEVPLPPRSGQTLAEAWPRPTRAATTPSTSRSSPSCRRARRPITIIRTSAAPCAGTTRSRPPTCISCSPGSGRPSRVDLATHGRARGRLPRLAHLCPSASGCGTISSSAASTRCANTWARSTTPKRLRDGWHGWRATLAAEAIRLPSRAELRTALTDEDLDASSPRTTHWLLWRRLSSSSAPLSAGAPPPSGRPLCRRSPALGARPQDRRAGEGAPRRLRDRKALPGRGLRRRPPARRLRAPLLLAPGRAAEPAAGGAATTPRPAGHRHLQPLRARRRLAGAGARHARGAARVPSS